VLADEKQLVLRKAKAIKQFDRVPFIDIGISFTALDELQAPRIMKSH
jgi:hypothetical protein